MVVNISFGILILAGATLFGALVGATVPEWLRTRKSRQNLRIALKAELESMIALKQLELPDEKESLKNLGDLPIPGYDMLPTTVFKSNANKIGQLTNDEIREVIKFYNSSFSAKSQITFLQKERELILNTRGQMDKGEYEETIRATYKLLKKLKEQRKTAIESIEDNL